jgi:predicted alpha-1,6-mannanase (GH76 family)
MVLTAEQQWMVATVYEKVAADSLSVPPQQRAAFARKARWFRMLARIRAKKEAAVVFKQRLPDPQHEAADSGLPFRRGDRTFQPPKQSPFGNAPSRARYETLAGRLERARQDRASQT